MHLAADLMEHGSVSQGKTQAKEVCTLLCERHCLVIPRHCLVYIPQTPQRLSVKAVASHARIFPIEKRRGTVLLGVVKGYPLRQMRVRSGYSSQVE
jgi:hypothetical protein